MGIGSWGKKVCCFKEEGEELKIPHVCGCALLINGKVPEVAFVSLVGEFNERGWLSPAS